MATRQVDLLAAARHAAHTASVLLADARPVDIRSKSNPRDLVTEWDVRAEAVIRTALEVTAPGVPIVGEEGGGDVDRQALHWVVDPIDGTVNFAHGLPMWCISIAAVEHGRPLAGVVHVPPLGWRFEAATGTGAVDHQGRRLRVSAISRLADALLSTGFPYDLPTNPDNNLAQFCHMQRVSAGCRRYGSAAIDLCLVAQGSFDGHWERRLSAWDIAAGMVIVEEAGGTVTDLTGGPADVYQGAVLATNGAIHNDMIRELARVSS